MEDHKNLLNVKNWTRREFLKAGIGMSAVVSGFELFPVNAAAQNSKNQISPTKEKKNCKIYPPKNGCLVGFHKEQHRKFQLGTAISDTINHYRNAFDANPAILAFWTFLSLGFPLIEAQTLKEKGVLPYVSIMTGHDKWRLSFDPDDVVQGRCDDSIARLAVDAAGFGNKHGGFFFTTMVEPNADWWYWSRKPNTVAAIKHIWQIFEDQGANQYATWVWEAFCPARYGTLVADPEQYYPGDKYVDWIGLNVFANLKNRHISENTMFNELMSKTYEQMRVNHPQKPIMVSEFGRTPGNNQPPWLEDAFRRMKNNFSAIKAAIYYDNITNLFTGQDHTLDERSLNTLKEIFKDPYWVMAK
jgi:hypothetical protein